MYLTQYTIYKYFYGFFCFLFIFPHTLMAKEKEIFLPPPPAQVIPPQVPKEKVKKNKQHRTEELNKKNAEIEEPVPTIEETYQQKVEEEISKPRDMSLMFQISLVIPTILVKEPRKKYTTEPTSHIHLFLNTQQESHKISLWWGMRAAFFNGTGIYNGIPGRYSFSYIGPMLGIGKVSGSIDKNNEGKKISAPSHAWFWMSGISAQTRQTKTEDPENKVNEDLYNSQKLHFDAPGLWSEWTYSKLKLGALSTNYFLGVQLGKGKVFAWIGVGVGGWD